ncbi:ATP-binding domain-containing protein [Micromonospora sp. ALFpr18c]|uniref:ATP-binding domain-containing protein n=1 Tax=Micromonospora sp. NPDC050695 TaxID=3154938 RepID=UPI001CEDA3CF
MTRAHGCLVSQGSEYPAVVIPITTSAWMMLQRNLLYTGIPHRSPGAAGACRPIFTEALDVVDWRTMPATDLNRQDQRAADSSVALIPCRS